MHGAMLRIPGGPNERSVCQECAGCKMRLMTLFFAKRKGAQSAPGFLKCKFDMCRSDFGFGWNGVLVPPFDRDHSGDFVIIVTDYHALLRKHDRTLQNGWVSLNETGELLSGQLINVSLQGSKCFGTCGNDVLCSVFTTGHEVFDFGFAQ